MERKNQTSGATKFTARLGVPRFSVGSKLLRHCETSAAAKTGCNRQTTATITHSLATAAVTQNFTATGARATHGQRGWNYSRSQT